MRPEPLRAALRSDYISVWGVVVRSWTGEEQPHAPGARGRRRRSSGRGSSKSSGIAGTICAMPCLALKRSPATRSSPPRGRCGTRLRTGRPLRVITTVSPCSTWRASSTKRFLAWLIETVIMVGKKAASAEEGSIASQTLANRVSSSERGTGRDRAGYAHLVPQPITKARVHPSAPNVLFLPISDRSNEKCEPWQTRLRFQQNSRFRFPRQCGRRSNGARARNSFLSQRVREFLLCQFRSLRSFGDWQKGQIQRDTATAPIGSNAPRRYLRLDRVAH